MVMFHPVFLDPHGISKDASLGRPSSGVGNV